MNSLLWITVAAWTVTALVVVIVGVCQTREDPADRAALDEWDRRQRALKRAARR